MFFQKKNLNCIIIIMMEKIFCGFQRLSRRFHGDESYFEGLLEDVYPDDDDEDGILGLVTSEVVDVVAVVGICCLYTQNMLDKRSMMMCGALS